jgi:predicted deacylase
MSPRKSKITAEIDFDRDGKHTGFLRVPHSVHRSAYGFLAIPIVSIRNGAGPRVLLLAGTHGDEYEGQVALTKLARELPADGIKGQLIIIPMLNFPAAQAGTRTSPVDDGNLNRVYPGDPDGTPTWMIAHFVECELMRRVEYSLDLHAGGSSLIYIPGAQARLSDDTAMMNQVLGLVRAFGAPNTYLIKTANEGGSLAAAARAGIVGLLAELGGAGMLTRETIAITERGVRNVLRHLGVLPGEVDRHPTRLMMVDRATHYVYAYDAGLFEPHCELGETVKQGDLAGLVQFPDTPWREPVPVRFAGDGVIVCKRVPARVERGDCVYHLASDYAP